MVTRAQFISWVFFMAVGLFVGIEKARAPKPPYITPAEARRDAARDLEAKRFIAKLEKEMDAHPELVFQGDDND